MKAYYFIPFLKWASRNPEEAGSIIGWLIGSAIEVVIISLIVAGIARMVNEKNVYEEWFVGSCVVFGIIEVLFGIISLF